MQSAFLPTTGVESLDQVYLLPIMNSYDFCSSKSTHLPDLEVARNRSRTTADSHQGTEGAETSIYTTAVAELRNMPSGTSLENWQCLRSFKTCALVFGRRRMSLGSEAVALLFEKGSSPTTAARFSLISARAVVRV
jgi:hypothetical protein